MTVIDFTEIPESHKGGGMQDSFEHFAHSFMRVIGLGVPYEISRGADGGIDLLVEENRTGSLGTTTFKWLVSCKHKAFSGKAVQPQDEEDLSDRIKTNNCHGFIGFYSTVVSSGLKKKFDGLRKMGIEVKIFDREEIESKLLEVFKFSDPIRFSEMKRLAERFFPKSVQAWEIKNPKPVSIFETPSLKCQCCGKELLTEQTFKYRDHALVSCWYEKDIEGETKVVSIHNDELPIIGKVVWSCKNECDMKLESNLLNNYNFGGWNDFGDYLLPPMYLKKLNYFIFCVQHNLYSQNALDEYMELINNFFPFISRHLNDEDNRQISLLMRIPTYLGGWGD